MFFTIMFYDFLNILWITLGSFLGSFMIYFGIIFGSIWDHFWDHFGFILGSFLLQFGIILGSFWDRFGVGPGSIWDRSGVILVGLEGPPRSSSRTGFLAEGGVPPLAAAAAARGGIPPQGQPGTCPKRSEGQQLAAWSSGTTKDMTTSAAPPHRR